MVRVVQFTIVATLFAGMAYASTAVGSFSSGNERVTIEEKTLREGCEITISGRVLGREKRPEGLSDGEMALRVSTADYGVVNVVYSSFRLCHNEVGAAAKEGDEIEVRGKVTRKDRITVCLSKDYYIKKL